MQGLETDSLHCEGEKGRRKGREGRQGWGVKWIRKEWARVEWGIRKEGAKGGSGAKGWSESQTINK